MERRIKSKEAETHELLIRDIEAAINLAIVSKRPHDIGRAEGMITAARKLEAISETKYMSYLAWVRQEGI